MAQRTANHASEMTLVTRSAEETQALAERMGALLQPGDVVALTGPLGAGKTCFVQGLARGMGVNGQVTSPTFILMRLHRGDTPLCHVDAYRLDGDEELLELGLDDWLEEAVVAVEWADRVTGTLPDARIEVRLAYHDDGREIRLLGIGERPSELVVRMSEDDPGN